MGKKNKVPEMPAPAKEEGMTGPISPVEIIFHAAGVNVEKIPTLQGTITLLQILSPTGWALTIRLSDDDVNTIVSELKGISIVTAPGLAVA